MSALAAPRPLEALATLRGLALFAIFLLLGASRALDGRRGRLVLAGALLAAGLAAASAIFQAAGLPLAVEVMPREGRGGAGGPGRQRGHSGPRPGAGRAGRGRRGPGARSPRARALALAAGALAVGGLVVGQSLTATAATLAGLAAMVAAGSRPGRRWLGGALLLAIGLGAALLLAAPPLRARAVEAAAAVRAGQWDRLTS
jgi:hypothetical protein